MKKNLLPRSTPWLTGAAVGLATFTGGERLAGAPWVDSSGLAVRRAAELERFARGYENILGTSLDLVIEAARPSDAMACEARILGEIERLRQILSTYDPASEIRRVMAGGPIESAELAELLAAYEQWSRRTDGLIDLNLGGVIDLWRADVRGSGSPDPRALAEAARQERAFNVDALGKGFIIDRAVAVARRHTPGGVLNLGGDIRAWGGTTWIVGVTDPRNPADNAVPLVRFPLRDAAVATSGGYARFYIVDGKKVSHLIDPRTRWPVAVGGSATIVAEDCVTANALSTSASIGGLDTGARLAREWGATGHFVVDAVGRVASGGVFLASAATPVPSPVPPPEVAKPAAESAAEKPAAPAAADWPANFQVLMQVVLKKHEGSRQIFRPYVAIWIQNARGQIVRTLAVWGSDERWQRKLSSWWNVPGLGGQEPTMTSRATRAPGAYSIAWNGLDDFGRRLPTGEYTVCLEVCREAGNHTVERIKLSCGQEPVTAAFRETSESGAGNIIYGIPEAPSQPSK